MEKETDERRQKYSFHTEVTGQSEIIPFNQQKPLTVFHFCRLERLNNHPYC